MNIQIKKILQVISWSISVINYTISAIKKLKNNTDTTVFYTSKKVAFKRRDLYFV